MAKDSQASAKALKASGHDRKDSSEHSASTAAKARPLSKGDAAIDALLEASSSSSDEAEEDASDSHNEQGSEQGGEGKSANDDDQAADPSPSPKPIKRLKSGEPVLVPIASLGLDQDVREADLRRKSIITRSIDKGVALFDNPILLNQLIISWLESLIQLTNAYMSAGSRHNRVKEAKRAIDNVLSERNRYPHSMIMIAITQHINLQVRYSKINRKSEFYNKIKGYIPPDEEIDGDYSRWDYISNELLIAARYRYTISAMV
jgi:hypothetical protein